MIVEVTLVVVVAVVTAAGAVADDDADATGDDFGVTDGEAVVLITEFDCLCE